MRTTSLPPLSLFTSVLLTSLAFAEKAPLSVNELKRQADAIVVATIEHIRVEPEPSRVERGFGNSDWGVYLTLRLETVEKGGVFDDPLEARCFRIRVRRSRMEYMTPSGHHPIPGTGTRVRAYLAKEENSWRVVLPNGITSVDDVDDWPGGNLQDAREVTQLRSRGYTYFLPVEIWIFLIFVSVPIFRAVRWYRSRQAREGISDATEQPKVAEP